MGLLTDDLTVDAYKLAYSQGYDHSYPNENIVHPVLPFSETTLSIGTCPNPLNNNSNYISILTGSPMSTTGLMQFLNLMRNGYNRGENNPNSSGCKFLRKRQL